MLSGDTSGSFTVDVVPSLLRGEKRALAGALRTCSMCVERHCSTFVRHLSNNAESAGGLEKELPKGRAQRGQADLRTRRRWTHEGIHAGLGGNRDDRGGDSGPG